MDIDAEINRLTEAFADGLVRLVGAAKAGNDHAAQREALALTDLYSNLLEQYRNVMTQPPPADRLH